MEKIYLVGENISYSLSPQIYNMLGVECEIKNIENEDKLKEFVRLKKYIGFNVTIPYKKSLIHSMDRNSEIVRKTSVLNAVANKNGKLIFIEFKNGCITSKMGKEQIRSKISESLLILTDILDAKLQEIRKLICYVLVYNRDKNELFEKQRRTSKYKLFTGIANFAKTNHLIKEFDRYRVFFHKVYTINEDELEEILDSL